MIFVFIPPPPPRFPSTPLLQSLGQAVASTTRETDLKKSSMLVDPDLRHVGSNRAALEMRLLQRNPLPELGLQDLHAGTGLQQVPKGICPHTAARETQRCQEIDDPASRCGTGTTVNKKGQRWIRLPEQKAHDLAGAHRFTPGRPWDVADFYAELLDERAHHGCIGDPRSHDDKRVEGIKERSRSNRCDALKTDNRQRSEHMPAEIGARDTDRDDHVGGEGAQLKSGSDILGKTFVSDIERECSVVKHDTIARDIPAAGGVIVDTKGKDEQKGKEAIRGGVANVERCGDVNLPRAANWAEEYQEYLNEQAAVAPAAGDAAAVAVTVASIVKEKVKAKETTVGTEREIDIFKGRGNNVGEVRAEEDWAREYQKYLDSRCPSYGANTTAATDAKKMAGLKGVKEIAGSQGVKGKARIKEVKKMAGNQEEKQSAGGMASAGTGILNTGGVNSNTVNAGRDWAQQYQDYLDGRSKPVAAATVTVAEEEKNSQS